MFSTDQDEDRKPRDHIGALADFWEYIKQDRPHRWASMGLAITVPLVIVYGIYASLIQPPPGRTIIYVESWPANRSKADIERDWKARAVQANADNAQRRAAYRGVAKALGIGYIPAPGTEGGPPLEAAASNQPAPSPASSDAKTSAAPTSASPTAPSAKSPPTANRQP